MSQDGIRGIFPRHNVSISLLAPFHSGRLEDLPADILGFLKRQVSPCENVVPLFVLFKLLNNFD